MVKDDRAPAIPPGATHEFEGRYYRSVPPGAYCWNAKIGQWSYMEDGGARRALAGARKLSKARQIK